MTTGAVGYGQMQPENFASDADVDKFKIWTQLARMRTAQLAKVTAVSGQGVSGPPGTVSVQLLVKQIDGQENSLSYVPMVKIPFLRLQAGNGAIVNDPVVGDVGLLVVCDRDITNVIANNGGESTPGSRRIGNAADSIFIGGLFGKAPVQSVAMTAQGITITDRNQNSLTLSSTGVALSGPGGAGFSITSGGITLLDTHNNQYVSTINGLTLSDGNGNSITLSATGWAVSDAHAQAITSGPTGVTVFDKNGNQIQMRAGFINFLTTQLQQNGVPIIVP